MNVSSLPYTLALAKRVKAAGMRLLLDLHYSDTWADPAHQAKLAAWKNLPFEALTAQVRGYSRDTLAAFRRAGAAPGRAPSIMLHIASGAQPGLAQWFFDSLNAKQQIDFDVIGLSFYPDGKDTLGDLKTALAALAQYGKPVVVVETGFPRTGTAGANQPVLQKCGRTPEGQKRYLTDLITTIKATPGGLGHGVVYWEPDWIGVTGLPHFGDDNALFDDRFNALPGLGALRP